MCQKRTRALQQITLQVMHDVRYLSAKCLVGVDSCRHSYFCAVRVLFNNTICDPLLALASRWLISNTLPKKHKIGAFRSIESIRDIELF